MKNLILNLLSNDLFKTLKTVGIKFPKMNKYNLSVFAKLKEVYPQFDRDDILFSFINKENKDLLINSFTCKCGNFKHSHLNFCSRKCTFFKQSVVNKMEQTNLEKRGVKQYFASEEFKEKSKQTCRKNFNSDTYWGSEQCKESRKKSNLDKYGFEYATQSQQVKDKTRQTCIKKYNKNSYSQTEECKKKVRNTSNKKYNKDYYSQTEEYKQRYKETMQKQHGVDNIFQLEETKEKSKQTCRKKYSKDYYTQTEEYKQRSQQSNLKKWGFKNPSQNELIKEKAKQTRIKKGLQYPDGIVNDFLSEWDFIRKPTAEDLQKFLHSDNLTFMYPLIKKSNLEQNFDINNSSYLEGVVEDFLRQNEIKFIKHERKIISPMELDFYLPDNKVAIEVNDIMTHNSTFSPFGKPKPKNYHFNKTKLCSEKGVRLIHLFEPYLRNEKDWVIIKDIILHACGKSKKIFARNTKLFIKPAIEMKQFFEDNHLQGYRNAKTAFILADKNTNEPLMCYTVGHAYFGKGKYDAEIARGACKLGYSIVGGASKLWKHIIEYYKNKNLDNNPGSINSIVYYVNLNYYNGQSMGFLDNVKFIKNQPSFWNYWVDTKTLRNREPEKHKEIQKLTKQGKVLYVGNSGTQVNVWERT